MTSGTWTDRFLAACVAGGISLTGYSLFRVGLPCVTLWPAVILLFNYVYGVTLQGLQESDSPGVQATTRISGSLFLIALALHQIERLGTINGISTWLGAFSLLVIGHGFGHSLSLRATSPDASQPATAPDVVLVPFACSLLAALVLRYAAVGIISVAIVANLYFGFTFALFSRRLPPSLARRLQMGGFTFPSLLALTLALYSPETEPCVLGIVLFLIGFFESRKH